MDSNTYTHGFKTYIYCYYIPINFSTMSANKHYIRPAHFVVWLPCPQCRVCNKQRSDLSRVVLSGSYSLVRVLGNCILLSLVCTSPLCFSNALGSTVGFSQYTDNFIYVYIYCMSRGRHVSASLILGHLQVHRSLCSLQCNARCDVAIYLATIPFNIIMFSYL